MNRNIQWPTREKWAENQTALYCDRFEDLDFDQRLNSYASPAEIETALRALKRLWKVKGNQMRALCVPKEIQRQQGESSWAHYDRRQAMTPEQQELVEKYFFLRGKRREINKRIKTLLDNEVPSQCRYADRSAVRDSTDFIREWIEVDKALRSIGVRYQAARESAEEKRRQEILNTPIDDAAWEEELARRAELETDRSEVVRMSHAGMRHHVAVEVEVPASHRERIDAILTK